MEKQLNLPTNLICLSHLRWDFVYQRPQHLLTRFAKKTAVYFYEEPIIEDCTEPRLAMSARGNNITILVPHLPSGLSPQQTTAVLERLFDQFISKFDLEQTLFWYYTPMALTYSKKHKPKAIVYDCMDELAGFKFADSNISSYEQQLFKIADIVFTGGHSLYRAKKQFHKNIHPFPSSIEKEHFQSATTCSEALDQADIKGPKIGFFGVIDERFDTKLISELARKKPEWNFILIGPVVKIDPENLPKNSNIHYLGQRSYADLPSYLSGWDVALLPFLLNESTRFISPTKTPEYLSANIPVVSTPIQDVISPYGEEQLVHICRSPETFVQAIEKELDKADRSAWQAKVSAFLKDISWDKTHSDMSHLISACIHKKQTISLAS